MTPTARHEATQRLNAHPDCGRWQDSASASTEGRQLFIAAATWADEIRRDPRFFTPGTETPTPLLAGFPDMERHAEWHTLARPLDAQSAPAWQVPTIGNLDTAIVAQSTHLARRPVDIAEQAIALTWLIHLVGDAHQPLHLSLRRDANGEWDWFGSRFRVRDPAGSRKSAISLHSYWDDLGGLRSLRGDALDTAIGTLIAHHPRGEMDVEAPVQQWLDESWLTAKDEGYPRSTDAIAIIDEDFRQRSHAIAERRLAQAGYRLGYLLNRLLDEGVPTKSPQ